MRLLAGAIAKEAGTLAAESFHSVLQRTAQSHNVSFTRYMTFMNAICRMEGDARPKSQDLIATVVGVGQRPRSLVDAYEELTGLRGYANHTLLPLAGVISPRANGALSKYQRWCPECIHPSKGVGYGMFAHVFNDVTHCRLHDAKLQRHCPECYRHQSYMASLFANPVCGFCKSVLWGRIGKQSQRSKYEMWAEDQLYGLAAYLTDLDRPRPNATWMRDAADTIHQLGMDAWGRLKGADSFQARLMRKSPKHGFQMPTLLWLAAHHSTTLVEVILRPNEVLTGVFPNLRPIRRKASVRHAATTAKWPLFRDVVRALLASGEGVRLPSSETLSALIGVGNILWAKDRELALRYNEERASYANGPLAAACDRAFSERVLRNLPDKRVAHYRLERILSRRCVPIPQVAMEEIDRAVQIVTDVLGPRFEFDPEELGIPLATIR